MVKDPKIILYLFLLFIFFGCTYFALYKKYISSFFDPLTFFVFNLSTASILMFQNGVETNWINILQFFSFQLFFWLGFSRVKVNFDKKVTLNVTNNDIIFLEYLTFTLFAIYLIANLYFFATVGAPIFASDPTIAKIDSYSGGLGFVKRINWGIANFVSCSALVLSLIGRYKKFCFFILLIQIIFSATSGSKGGTFLNYIFLIALLANRNEFKNLPQLSKYLKLIKYMFVTGALTGIFVLYAKFGDVNKSMLAFAHRVMMSGDVIIYYYNPDVLESFRSHGLLNYILHELNPILGFFRIMEYEHPLGYQMVNRFLATYSTEELATFLGPNVPFFVEGHIYFGAFAGLGYSFMIGFIVSYVRKQFFNRSNIGLIPFIFLFNLNSLIFVLPQDSNFFITVLFDSMFLTIIVYLFYMAAFSAVRPNTSTKLNYLQSKPL